MLPQQQMPGMGDASQPFNAQNNFSGTFQPGRGLGLAGAASFVRANPNPAMATAAQSQPKADMAGMQQAMAKVGAALVYPGKALGQQPLTSASVGLPGYQPHAQRVAAIQDSWLQLFTQAGAQKNATDTHQTLLGKSPTLPKFASDGVQSTEHIIGTGHSARHTGSSQLLSGDRRVAGFDADSEKRAEQNNSAEQRSAVGESTGLTFDYDEANHHTGKQAWQSMSKYFRKTAKPATEPDPFKGQHAGGEKAAMLRALGFEKLAITLAGMTPADVYQNTQAAEMQQMQAQQPPPGAMPPGGGMPPGAMPPQDPAAAGGMPPGAMPPGGGMPPQDPNAGGMLPPDMPQGGMPPNQSPIPGPGSAQRMEDVGMLASSPDDMQGDLANEMVMKQAGFNDYQIGFFTYCLRQGLTAGQMKQAIDAAHEKFGAEASTELYQGLEKAAGLGDVGKNAVGWIKQLLAKFKAPPHPVTLSTKGDPFRPFKTAPQTTPNAYSFGKLTEHGLNSKTSDYLDAMVPQAVPYAAPTSMAAPTGRGLYSPSTQMYSQNGLTEYGLNSKTSDYLDAMVPQAKQAYDLEKTAGIPGLGGLGTAMKGAGKWGDEALQWGKSLLGGGGAKAAPTIGSRFGAVAPAPQAPMAAAGGGGGSWFGGAKPPAASGGWNMAPAAAPKASLGGFGAQAGRMAGGALAGGQMGEVNHDSWLDNLAGAGIGAAYGRQMPRMGMAGQAAGQRAFAGTMAGTGVGQLGEMSGVMPEGSSDRLGQLGGWGGFGSAFTKGLKPGSAPNRLNQMGSNFIQGSNSLPGLNTAKQLVNPATSWSQRAGILAGPGTGAAMLGGAGYGLAKNTVQGWAADGVNEGMNKTLSSPEFGKNVDSYLIQSFGIDRNGIKQLLAKGKEGMGVLSQFGDIPDKILGMFMGPEQLAGMNPVMKWMMILGGGSMLGGMLTGNNTATGLGAAGLGGAALLGGFPGLFGGGQGAPGASQGSPEGQMSGPGRPGGQPTPYAAPTQPQARNELQAQAAYQQQ